MAVILTYHHITDRPSHEARAGLYVSPAAFETQMMELKRSGRRVVALDALREELLGGNPSRPEAVAITFDDGYRDNCLNAFPVLGRMGFPATFFMVSGWIGGKGADGSSCMDKAELKDLADSGMAVGSHTATHPRLADLPLDAARREMGDSKSALEDLLGRRVDWLCYPKGSFSRAIADEARTLGYRGACSVIRDNRAEPAQLYWLPRVMVMNGISTLRFRYYFSPLYHWVHARKNRRRWKDLA